MSFAQGCQRASHHGLSDGISCSVEQAFQYIDPKFGPQKQKLRAWKIYGSFAEQVGVEKNHRTRPAYGRIVKSSRYAKAIFPAPGYPQMAPLIHAQYARCIPLTTCIHLQDAELNISRY